MRLGKKLARINFGLILLACFGVFAFTPSSSQAQTTDSTPTKNPDEIQTKIDTRSNDIKNLEKEILEYQSQINELSNKASSLADTLKSLDLNRKKLLADIKLTQDKIANKNLEIKQLNSRIGGTETTITDQKRYVAESYRHMAEAGSFSLPKLLLSGQSITNTWGEVSRLSAFENNLQDRISDLSKTKEQLESNRKSTERAKADLINLEKQLKGQKGVVEATKAEQARLLADTRNSETAFQELLDQKKELKDAFEREQARLESELKLTVDPTALPTTGQSVLSWPLDNVFITQYFGNTPFASRKPQLYSGAGHNGIDLRASIGTPIKAALSGVVVGSGNTDTIRRCYSLGKWILIRHPDGLSTLYAHLSFQSVPVGVTVRTGDVIGYSGNSGYSTGPHLHFGVYASSGIQIKQFVESAHCKGAVLPVAVRSAYLNPLSYLPAIPN